MRIAVFGSGKMGSLVTSLAGDMWVDCIEDADVCIDFSHASAVQKHVARAMMHKVPLVIGTTGWQDQFQHVETMVRESKGALLYGANFSEGMYLFSRLIRHAKNLLHGFETAGYEIHHKDKRDAPSGTAQALSALLGEKKESAPLFQSVRLGTTLGVHSVLFDGADETIECTHRAKTRAGYAQGALSAAAWLRGKTGIFTFDEYMETRLACIFREQSLRS